MSEQEQRELDAAVAEEVMGYKPVYVPADARGDNRGEMLVPPGGLGKGYILPPLGEIPLTFMVPRYSSDIAAAWSVVERLRGEGWIVRVQEMPDGEPFRAGAGWRPEENREIPRRSACVLYGGSIGSQVTILADSAPEAICRAALEWARRRQ